MSHHGLTEAQARVTEHVLGEEGARRRHLVVALSGAHAYGFPSPDSDVDLKAVHIESTERLLSLAGAKPTVDRLGFVDGVEIDYTSNELCGVLAGILNGNGNYAERVLTPAPLAKDPELDGLVDLVRDSLSRRLFHHYRGFATSQARSLEGDAVPAKRVLYVLRTALTGAHVLRTGELVTDLSALADDYGFPDARALIDEKRRGEKTPLPPAELERWRSAVGRAFEALDAALERSILPAEPTTQEALDRWLLGVRRRDLDRPSP